MILHLATPMDHAAIGDVNDAAFAPALKVSG